MTRITASPVPAFIDELHRSDSQTGGHPVLPPQQIPAAYSYLERLMLDPADQLRSHVAFLEQVYGVRFVPPLPRSWRQGTTTQTPTSPVGFPHCSVLPERVATPVLEGGVERLPQEELPRLLLNPLALWDLNDLINTLLTEYWIGRMENLGIQLAKENGIDLYEDFETVLDAPLSPRQNTASDETWLGHGRGGLDLNEDTFCEAEQTQLEAEQTQLEVVRPPAEAARLLQIVSQLDSLPLRRVVKLAWGTKPLSIEEIADCEETSQAEVKRLLAEAADRLRAILAAGKSVPTNAATVGRTSYGV